MGTSVANSTFIRSWLPSAAAGSYGIQKEVTMLDQELASLRVAADFLEDNGMSQCRPLRDAIRVLEFIQDGGSVYFGGEGVMCRRNYAAHRTVAEEDITLEKLAEIVEAIETSNAGYAADDVTNTGLKE
jgi:hypothetical protein